MLTTCRPRKVFPISLLYPVYLYINMQVDSVEPDQTALEAVTMYCTVS